MAFTASLIGVASATNATSVSITTNRVNAGAKIFAGLCIDKDGFDDIVDSAGNVYNQVAGSQNGVGAFLFEVTNSLLLPNNSFIRVDNNVSLTPFSARLAAMSVTGLNAGNLDGSSAGQGTDANPLCALSEVPANDWCVALVSVAAGSTNPLTQPAGWSVPGNISAGNGFSAYFAAFHAVNGGTVVYNPTLLTPATWAALMVALSP